MTTKALIEQALSLPINERVDLAELLWQSIHDGLPSGSESDAIEQAAERLAELTSGEVAGRSHAEVMQAAHRAVQCD